MNANPLLRGFQKGFARPEKLTVSQWADKYRILPQETSSEYGAFRTARAEFSRDMMDAFTDPTVTDIVFKLPSQVVKTESMVNMILYAIHQDPGPMLVVNPDMALSKKFSTVRIQKSVDIVPELLELVGSPVSRKKGNTVDMKEFPGGFLALTTANSPAGLAAQAIRYGFADEIDKFSEVIGNDGDTIGQFEQRLVTFKRSGRSKLVMASTPSLRGISLIDRKYEETDQRIYKICCPSCQEYIFLRFEPEDILKKGIRKTIYWKKGEPDTARYCCTTCGTMLEQQDLLTGVRNGKWFAQKPFKGKAGFHMEGLCSPWITMAQLVEEWEEARGNPGKEQTFFNLKRGLSYRSAKKAVSSPEELMNRAEDFSLDQIPMRVLLIVGSVDVQGDRLELQITGFGAGEERWVLDRIILPGDPKTSVPWDMLAVHLSRKFQHPMGREMTIEATAIDANYETDTVLRFCRQMMAIGKKVYGIKGVGGHGVPIWRESKEKRKDGGRLYLVGVHSAKMNIYQSLVIQKHGDSFIHFSNRLPLEWYQQLIAEEIVTERKSGRVFEVFVNPKGKRNEALDLMVYAMAARAAIPVNFKRRLLHFMTPPKKALTPSEIAQLYQ